ncbi:MAG: hypothetical protein ABIY50_11040 [Ignavibacteria bacterium]
MEKKFLCMRFTLNHFLVILLFIISPRFILADSPLTSTPFHDDYTDVDIVLKAEQLNIMDKEIADYLNNESNPIDVKAAVINALGWEAGGNFERYCQFAFDRLITEADLSDLNKSDAFTIGYLLAMENYLDPDKAVVFLKKARELDKKSFTVNIIYNLVRAQIAMEKDFCKVWKYSNKVFENKSLKDDMRSGAKKIIYDYVFLYKNYCK